MLRRLPHKRLRKRQFKQLSKQLHKLLPRRRRLKSLRKLQPRPRPQVHPPAPLPIRRQPLLFSSSNRPSLLHKHLRKLLHRCRLQRLQQKLRIWNHRPATLL